MLIDVRTYRCRPGTINTHLTLYEKYGKEPQFRCLGSPLAYLKERQVTRMNMYTSGSMKMRETERLKELNYMQMKNGLHICKKALI